MVEEAVSARYIDLVTVVYAPTNEIKRNNLIVFTLGKMEGSLTATYVVVGGICIANVADAIELYLLPDVVQGTLEHANVLVAAKENDLGNCSNIIDAVIQKRLIEPDTEKASDVPVYDIHDYYAVDYFKLI